MTEASKFTAGDRPDPDIDEPGLWFYVRNNEILVVADDDGPSLPDHDEHLPGEGIPHFLGHLDQRPCWAVDVLAGTNPPPSGGWLDLRALYASVPETTWHAAGRAVQLVEWRRTHRYCGRCGVENDPAPNERAMRCPDCGLMSFPRLAPAAIMRIERDDHILLARNKRFPLPMYSVLAGFVEPGESVEETVHREVREEVGLEVTDVRYVASQPWPFPHSLMLGFSCRWVEGEITPDPEELAEADWFPRDDLPPIPPRMSIARRLIDEWLEDR